MKATNDLLSTRLSLRPTTVIIIEWRSTYTEALQGNHCNFTPSPSGMICSLYFPVLTWINTDVGKPLKCTCLRMRQRSLTEESWRSVHLICLALSSKIVLFMIEPYSYKYSGELTIPCWLTKREGKLTVNCRIASHSTIGTEDSRPVFSTHSKGIDGHSDNFVSMQCFLDVCSFQ